MCGICGIATVAGDPVDEQLLHAMNNTMVHRGPDDVGYYCAGSVGLGVRRLSIIDLSTGHQPIANEDGTIHVAHNGEIYNFEQLRAQLEQKGHVFQTRTDTEVIIHAYEEYGSACVEHFNGMFAFAVWDERRQRLLLARDRLGIKPLFYHVSPHRLLFASELKAILAHPNVPRDINLLALDQFLALEYIPAPATIFEHIHKLPPGHLLLWEQGRVRTEQYWDIPVAPITLSEEECAEKLGELLEDAVRLRMIADVPVGAFLSGGIDSSTIVSYMSRLSDVPVRTFSVGFDDASYNELPYARLVARQFETIHHEELIDPHISDIAANLVRHFDEPFADCSIFSTYLVSAAARGSVKVVLSGDGGDEIFAGYDTYVAQRLATYYERWLPTALRERALPRLMQLIPPQPQKKGLVNKAKRFIEGGALSPALQHTRWMIFIPTVEKRQLYHPDVRHALNGAGAEASLKRFFGQNSGRDALAQQQYADIKTYLADDILAKVDRMSMAVSLEARVPLLDHRIVELALNLPPEMKLKGMETKAILRRTMAQTLPQEILERPKEGFSVPLKHWLGNELRPLMTDLLSHDSLRAHSYFNPDCVSRWVDEHITGRANHSHRLWALMVFELWRRHTLQQSPATTGSVPEVRPRRE